MEVIFSPTLTAIRKHGISRSNLIPILHEIQKEYRYLPEDALRSVAEIMDIPLVDVYGVATFFTSFSLEPKGKHQVTMCMGTACHVRRSGSVLEEAKRFLGIEPGETTEDMLFTLETVNCLGACALGPIVVIDGKYHGQVTPAKVKELLQDVADAERVPEYAEDRIAASL
ncbi:MAG: NADH-quinone oxidoreductase subunit NuoE [Actinobacteria bacterium]|nr:NADH-quinone oxidoreductase subunit NuoE [Actinomycetota bacterium]